MSDKTSQAPETEPGPEQEGAESIRTTRLDPVHSGIAPVTRDSPAQRAAAARKNPAALEEWELEAADVATRLLREPEDLQVWGICLYVAENEPEIQKPAFFWFRSRADLLEFVRTNLPLNARRFNRADPFGLRAAVEEVVAEVARGRLAADDALVPLNDLLAPYATIEWWGRYSSLLTGNGSFERDLRRWFRERSGAADAIEAELGGLAPIGREELEDFEAALVAYAEPREVDLPREHVRAPRRHNPERLSAADTLEQNERFATIDDLIEGQEEESEQAAEEEGDVILPGPNEPKDAEDEA